jgi:PAS domain S-box-containing protein
MVTDAMTNTAPDRSTAVTRWLQRATLASRMTIATASLVLLSVLAVGELTYRNVESMVVPRAISRVELELRLLTTQLASYVRGAREDIAGFRASAAIQEIIRNRAAAGADPADNAAEQDWRMRLAMHLAAELAAKPAYDKFQLIAFDSGRELVRVDRRGPNGTIRIVPDDALLDKSNRDYVKAAAAMPPDQIYVSPVELERNVEGSAVRTPHIPVLRIAGIVQLPDRKPFGIIIIDVDMRPIFRDIAAGARPGSRIYIVDDHGNYLVHPDPAREYGHDLDKPSRWQNDFPGLVAGFNKDAPSAAAITETTGENVVGGISAITLAGGPRVAVLEVTPRSIVLATAAAVGRSTVLVGSIAFLCACGFAVLLARSLTRPLVQMTAAVEAFPRQRSLAVPVGAAGEIGVLAGAFARMMEEVNSKTASLEREVQEHQRTEAELARHADRERLFGAAVQSSYDAIVTMTSDGIVTGWNPAAVRLFGWSADDIFGRSIDLIVPNDRQKEIHNILDRIRGGETVSQPETVRVSKDHRSIEVSLTVSPIKLPSGAIIGACQIARDVTDSRKAKLLLEQESNERRRIAEILHNTITSMVDAVLVADQHANILLSNPAAERLLAITTGMTKAEWTTSQDVFMDDGTTPMPAEARPLMRAIRGEWFENYELVVRNRDGLPHFILVSHGGPIHRNAQDETGALVVYRDVTEAKETARQLLQSQKMEALGQLTGGIAHDFNNILTVITGTIEIMSEGVVDRPELAAIAKMIDDAAGRGAELTRHLVAFSRRQPLEPRETNVNEIIVEAGRLLRPTLGESIEIDAILADDVSLTLIDPSQLATALLNLAINSRDAMAHGGKLMLETANVDLDENYAGVNADVQPGRYVMIAVSDTGTGIPSNIVDKVFDPFFTTKDVGKGSGLGLSMVYGFVKQSGGHIKIYSEEGHGTTIKIYFPCVTGAAPELFETATAEPIRGGSETILVVEDDMLVRNYVVSRLQALGYTTIAATNAAEAFVHIDSGAKIDLLFTDVVMPGPMNGRQLADAAVAHRPELRVLFTSGYTETAIVHHGRLDPGVLLLAKPYRKSDMARMIRAALEARSNSPPPAASSLRNTA